METGGSITIVNPNMPNPDIEIATDHFEKHRGHVLGIALRYAPDRDLAEDVVQQVYLEFVSHFERWDLEGDIRALLNVMARNFARRLWQDRIRLMPEKRRELARRLQALAESQDESACEEEIQFLQICLKRLPENENHLLHQRYRDKKTIVEIAESIPKDPATLRSVFARIRKKLKLCIESQMKQGEQK